jgi:putative sterol carrier protein
MENTVMLSEVHIAPRRPKSFRPRIRAQAFFAQALPFVLSSDPDASLPHASIGFDLTGVLGGRWTVHLDERRVVPRLEHADVVVRMSVASFEGMLRGALDASAALRVGAIRVDGDRSALAALGTLLVAHGNGQ